MEVSNLALLRRQLSNGILKGQALRVVHAFRRESIEQGPARFLFPPDTTAQHRVALVPDSPPHVMRVVLEVARVPQQRGEHLLNRVLGTRRICEQHHGIAVQVGSQLAIQPLRAFAVSRGRSGMHHSIDVPRVGFCVFDSSARRGGGCLAESGRLGRRGRLPRIAALASRMS